MNLFIILQRTNFPGQNSISGCEICLSERSDSLARPTVVDPNFTKHPFVLQLKTYPKANWFKDIPAVLNLNNKCLRSPFFSIQEKFRL